MVITGKRGVPLQQLHYLITNLTKDLSLEADVHLEILLDFRPNFT